MYAAYFDLGTKGITSWDKDEGCKVSHDRVGYLRGISAIVFILFFILLSAFGIINNNNDKTLYSMNKDLSHMINEDISLNSINEVNNSLVYHYQYVKKKVEDIDKANLFSLKADWASKICNNGDTEKMLSEFKSVIFIYTDSDNKQVDYVEFNKDDCAKSEIDLYYERLPIMIDKETQLNKIDKYNSIFIFDYNIITASKDSVDLNKLKEVLSAMLIANTCQNINAFEMIPGQKGTIYRYSDKNNQELVSISVFPSDCNDQGK